MRRFSFRPGLELGGRKFSAYTIGPVLSLIGFVFKASSWAPDVYKAGGWVILAGAITSVATALTGFFDWLNTDKGTQMRRMVNAHASTMITLTVVVLVELWYRYLAESGEYYGRATWVSALLALAILGLVTLGGTLGGSLTYDWGFNVEIATDHAVYHPSQHDMIHPHDLPPREEVPLESIARKQSD